MTKRRRPRREDYTVGWVCALPIELAAAHEMLDEEHEDLDHDASDTNIYTLGRVGEHNVVIACLPESQIGNNSAATVAVQMKSAFKSIRFGLMVGIGGGVPNKREDIRLGDVVVSIPHKDHGGVVQYDIGKTTPNGFERTGWLSPPPTILLNAIAKLKANYFRGKSKLLEYAPKFSSLPTFTREDVGPDELFEADYRHVGGPTCAQCCKERLVHRPLRSTEIMVHYGTIASGNRVMRDAIERDKVSAELDGVFCFEMEAAGLMNSFPCLVIRGISDYADSHKNKKWQPYAAGTAAAYAKELLSVMPTGDVANSLPANEMMSERNVLDSTLNRLPSATEAPFNSYHRQHEPTCLPDTRVDLLREIDDWTDELDERNIFWLRGLAGTGKSTIARTVARKSFEQGTLGASFFFSRGNGDIGHAGKFVTSIAVQLASSIPTLQHYICDSITDRSDIVSQSLQDQWDKLIIGPLSKLKDGSCLSSYILVVDALDECEDENNIRIILRLLTKVQSLKTVRLRAFITSRPEIPIRHSFYQIPEGQHKDFVLHHISQAVVEHDISVFLERNLREIAQERSLEVGWPGEETLQRLIQNAGGLFIWAATACRFVREGKRFAVKRLSMILERSVDSVTAPEKHLNEIYITVLNLSVSSEYTDDEKEEFCEMLRHILGSIVLLLSPLSTQSLSGLIQVSSEDVDQTLDDLHTILDIPNDQNRPLRVHHPSFGDFLLDKDRCGDPKFWVDEKQGHQKLATCCISLMSASIKQDVCDLKTPGALITDLESSQVEKHLPAEVQYACLYWVRHLKKSGVQLEDNDQFHRFLQDHLLHWLEALSWMRKMSEGIVAITTLESIALAFIHDIKRFALYSRPAIEQAPLQAYCSALIFAPTMSLVRKQFERWIPRYMYRLPKVEEDWNALLATMEGHEGSVRAVAFSPDGRRLASASDDETVRLWDTQSGDLLATLEGHEESVKAIGFSPDGKQLASGSYDEVIRLWNTDSGKPVATLGGHTRSVNAVAFSPDGKKLASASDDQTVRLWDTQPESLGVHITLKGHGSAVRSIAFSPDSTQLASASWDRTIKIWDARSGVLIKTLEDHTSSVNAVAFSPDGKQLASASHDRTIRVWDAQSGDTLSILKGHGSSVRAVAFSPDGKQLASASWDKTVKLWDVKSEAVATLKVHGRSVNTVAFSSDGKQLASASDDKTVRLWDARSGVTIAPLEIHKDTVRAVVFSPDGTRLASASDDKTVRIWDVQSGNLYARLDGHEDSVKTVAFAPDGKRLASASDDGTVKLWDACSGASILTLKVDAIVRTLSFSYDGTSLETDRGLLRTPSLSPIEAPPRPELSHDIFVKEQWVTLGSENALWLPPEHRPSCAVVRGSIVALGHASGRVSIFELIL